MLEKQHVNAQCVLNRSLRRLPEGIKMNKFLCVVLVGVGVLLVAPTNLRADGTVTILSTPFLTAVEGTPVSGIFATFTDTNGLPVSDFSVPQIQWGDGTTSVGTLSSTGPGSTT